MIKMRMKISFHRQSISVLNARQSITDWINFLKTKKLQENLFASKDAFPNKEAFQQEVTQINETYEQIKQHLVDTNIVVKKVFLE